MLLGVGVFPHIADDDGRRNQITDWLEDLFFSVKKVYIRIIGSCVPHLF